MTDINKPQGTKQAYSQVLADVAKDNARTVADAAAGAATRKSAEAVQQGSHATADAMRQNADATADVARRGSEAGADAMRRAGEAASETTRRGTQAVVEGQRQIAQDAAQRFEEMGRKVAEAGKGTMENVRQLMALPNAAEGGLRDLQQGVTSLIEGAVQTNLRAVQELLRLANPAPFVEMQQRFAREYTDTLVRNGATLVRAMRRTADETLHPLEKQVRQREQGSQYQTAAE